jgi:hypothetical protein
MTVGGLGSGNVGTTIVRVLSEDGTVVIAEVVTDASNDYLFTTPAVPPGTYVVAAGTDRDGDTVICDIEDACGVWPSQLTVNASGDDVTDVDILVTEGAGPQAPPTEGDSEE